MADNVQGHAGAGTDPTFRTTEVTSGLHLPHVLAGEKQRSYDGVESVSIGSGVSTLTVPSGATHAEVYCDSTATTLDSTNFVRYWHATNPSATVGVRLYHDQTTPTAQPAQFRATQGSGSSALVLRVMYYHYV